MVKFITRTICMALVTALCVGSLNAQEYQRVKVEPKVKEITFLNAQKTQLPAIPHRGSMTDDVEGHTAFTINSPGHLPWTYYNGNPSPTWGIQNVDFPGMGEAMAYIVFKPSATTPPINHPAHSGTQFFACFSTMSGANNAWIISPSFTVLSNAKITFWARVLNSTYPETFKVATSTTGNAHTNFTNVISPGNVTTSSQTWVQYTYDIPNEAKYVAINCISNDQFALFIDDITIDGIDVYVPPACDAITNLQAEIQGTDVKLTWTAAPGTPTGYKVYDGAAVLGTVTATEYVAKNLTPGTHIFGVEALYGDDCAPVKVTKTVDMPVPLNPIKNLNGTCVDGTLNLTWTAPDPNVTGYHNWLTYSSDDFYGGLGYGVTTPANVYWAQRWSPADLAAKGITTGAKITGMKFVFSSMPDNNPPAPINSGTYAVKIWQGGTATTCGTEKYSQDVPFSSLIAKEWNEVTFATPVIIDATQELWLGVHSNVDAGYPMAYDGGPIVHNVNLFKANSPSGTWTKAESVTGMNGNWNVAGYVDCAGGTPIELSHYNIYKDDTKLDQTTATTFTKADMPDGKSNYCVVAVYQDDSQAKKVCKEITCVACPAVTQTKAVIASDCKTATVTWTAAAGAKEYKITREGIAPVTVENSPYTEEYDFENGVTYTWTITTICPSGKESDGVIAETKPTCVGIIELANDVSIYPNPVSEMVTIDVDNFLKVEVYNTVGQLIETQTVQRFDVSNYNTGIYFFKVFDANNNSVTKRVMVAK